MVVMGRRTYNIVIIRQQMKHLILDATENGTVDPIWAIIGFFVIAIFVCFPLFVRSCDDGEDISGSNGEILKHDKIIAKDEEIH